MISDEMTSLHNLLCVETSKVWTEIKIVELHLHVTWPAAALEESGETNRDIVLTAALVCIAAMLDIYCPAPSIPHIAARH